MRWPLRNQILIPFGGVTLAAVAAVSLANAYLAAHRSEATIVSQMSQIGRTIRGAAYPLTSAVLRQASGLSGAQFVVTDRAGGILAATGDVAAMQPGRLAMNPSRGVEFAQIVELNAQRFFHAAVDIDRHDAGQEASTLHILFPESAWREARWQAAYPSLWIGGAALVLVGGLSLLMAGRLCRPMQRLREKAARMAQGDFHEIPVPQRNDELRDLVVSVNRLAMELDELRQAIKRSERLRLLGQMSAGLAHTLRNDVTGARIAIQLHCRHCRQVDQESLAVALRQLTLSEEHLQGFLALGKPQPPRCKECDLQAVLAETVRLVQPACKHRQVALDVRLPDFERSTTRFVDADQLRQLLINLVLNALDAAGAGGWIRVELDDADPGAVHIRVRDSGPGPPEFLAERLFEPFVTGKPEGMGLGLAVARQIAEAHGGSLVLSQDGGTCFDLSIPASSDEPCPRAWNAPDETIAMVGMSKVGAHGGARG